jgi:hypothetical protein
MAGNDATATAAAVAAWRWCCHCSHKKSKREQRWSVSKGNAKRRKMHTISTFHRRNKPIHLLEVRNGIRNLTPRSLKDTESTGSRTWRIFLVYNGTIDPSHHSSRAFLPHTFALPSLYSTYSKSQIRRHGVGSSACSNCENLLVLRFALVRMAMMTHSRRMVFPCAMFLAEYYCVLDLLDYFRTCTDYDYPVRRLVDITMALLYRELSLQKLLESYLYRSMSIAT